MASARTWIPALAALLAMLAGGCPTRAQAPPPAPRPRVAVQAGDQRVTVEQTFIRDCRAVTVTTDAKRSDYLFRLEHHHWTVDHWNHDRWELTRANGDIMAGGAAKTIGRAVKAACAALGAASADPAPAHPAAPAPATPAKR